jgi:hypothetical protein
MPTEAKLDEIGAGLEHSLRKPLLHRETGLEDSKGKAIKVLKLKHFPTTEMLELQSYYHGDRFVSFISSGLWPARSPNFSTCGFYLYEAVKQNVFRPNFHLIQDLKQNVRRKITPVSRRISIRDVNFLQMCQ